VAEQTVVHIGQNSREYVPFLLLRRIANIQGKAFNEKGGMDRKGLLDTYAECLNTVQTPTGRITATRR
jgi:hypothetical protein